MTAIAPAHGTLCNDALLTPARPGPHLPSSPPCRFPDVNVWQNIGILAAMITCFRFLTYILMRRFTKTRT